MEQYICLGKYGKCLYFIHTIKHTDFHRLISIHITDILNNNDLISHNDEIIIYEIDYTNKHINIIIINNKKIYNSQILKDLLIELIFNIKTIKNIHMINYNYKPSYYHIYQNNYYKFPNPYMFEIFNIHNIYYEKFPEKLIS